MAHEASKNAQQIVDTAIVLFKTRGYDNVSILEICQTAGIPRSSVYAMFSK